MISRRVALWALGYGLLIWFEATLIIRWADDLIFVPESFAWSVGLFLLTAWLVFAVGWFFFYAFQTPPIERAGAAILICAVGLVANTFVTLFIDRVFPNMTAPQERLFAAWLAWAYGIGLVSGVWPARMPRVPA
ncbi:MAG TPA: DUF5367 family protein [Roseiflexaceae bacterium]|jgi:Family of unknown function (DUF5367)|nr:DUF5367 family protein [Roseiflexaceae bacterium]